MPRTTEQFVDANQANVEAMAGMATHAFGGFEQLVELNMATSKAAMEDAFSHTHAVLDVKDAQQLLALQAGLLQPLAMKNMSYGSRVYDINTDVGAGVIKGVTTLVENVEKLVPSDTVPVVAVLKSTVIASQKAIETAQATAKKAVELAESNLAALAKKAGHSVTFASTP